MEIQTTRKQELAQTESRALKFGSGLANAIIEAQSHQTLRQSDEEEIKQSLRYAMLFVGLRGNNLPSEEEKYVLLKFIKSNFGNQTPQEIVLAFEYAVAGKLNVDAKCYENFSCEYFSRIMNAYIEFARAETKLVVKEIEAPKPIPSEADQKMTAINIANMYSQEIIRCQEKSIKMVWLAGGLHSLYDSIVKFGIYEASEEDKKRIYLSLLPKYKDKDELLANCKAQCYKEFVENLADFKAYLTAEGKIEPID
jgi:hypothetical protein